MQESAQFYELHGGYVESYCLNWGPKRLVEFVK